MSRVSETTKTDTLRDRAKMLAACRNFFQERNILEMDCPALTSYACLDPHVGVMRVDSGGSERYLHTSPEYGLKRLLVEGMGDIYQMSHVFRAGECGPRHNPEFTMVEWYRVGSSEETFQKEVADFCRLFLGALPCEKLTYREALLRYAGVDYLTASRDDLAQICPPPSSSWDARALLQLIFTERVEPQLGLDKLTLINHFPAADAALSQVKVINGEAVAERFEIYYKSFELANGYHELQDPDELLRRFEGVNALRAREGLSPLPPDRFLIEAQREGGLPDCYGVAVGFDRLMQVRLNAPAIADVLPFDFHHC